jgi:mRNA-degrading endonuclease RelE of RelBE toxin-antitoxin system
MIVAYSKTALSYLQRLDQKTKKRIFEATQNLPVKGDIIKMKSQKIQNIYRLRVGSYRIIFQMEKDLIKILDIAPRGEAYKGKFGGRHT